MTILKKLIEDGLSKDKVISIVRDSILESDFFYKLDGWIVRDNNTIYIEADDFADDEYDWCPHYASERIWFKNQTDEIRYYADLIKQWLINMELDADFVILLPFFSELDGYGSMYRLDEGPHLGIKLIH